LSTGGLLGGGWSWSVGLNCFEWLGFAFGEEIGAISIDAISAERIELIPVEPVRAKLIRVKR
jgi:hypothetical protein